MTVRTLIALFVGVAVATFAFAHDARAAELRHPQTGDPALTMRIPDGWQSYLDGRGDLHAVSPDKMVAITLSIRATRVTRLDLSAITSLPHNQISRQDVTVSGYRGTGFRWTSTKGDTALMVQTAAVLLGNGHVAICHVITSPSISPPMREAAKAAFDSLALTPQP